MEIVLVRHAQPDWEPGGRAVDEPALTKRGLEQARLLATALGGEVFDAVHASPHRRALETAAPVAEALGLAIEQSAWLRELAPPSLEGKTPAQVRDFFRSARSRQLEDWWEGMPGGESFQHFYERVSSGIEGLLAGGHRVAIHADAAHRVWHVPDDAGRILIVAHEGTISVILSHLLGVEPVPWSWLRFSSAWTGVSRLHTVPLADGCIWGFESFNNLDHLGTSGEGLPDGHTRRV